LTNAHDDRIDKNVDRGGSVTLTCRNHPALTWHTKNIDYVGARSIFSHPSVRPDPVVTIAKQYKLIGQQTTPVNAVGWPTEHPPTYTEYTEAQWRRDLQTAIDEHDKGVAAGLTFECACPFSDLILVPRGQTPEEVVEALTPAPGQ
jgi:hypothetical protein